jgi:hypothetical protein
MNKIGPNIEAAQHAMQTMLLQYIQEAKRGGSLSQASLEKAFQAARGKVMDAYGLDLYAARDHLDGFQPWARGLLSDRDGFDTVVAASIGERRSLGNMWVNKWRSVIMEAMKLPESFEIVEQSVPLMVKPGWKEKDSG